MLWCTDVAVLVLLRIRHVDVKIVGLVHFWGLIAVAPKLASKSPIKKTKIKIKLKHAVTPNWPSGLRRTTSEVTVISRS